MQAQMGQKSPNVEVRTDLCAVEAPLQRWGAEIRTHPLWIGVRDGHVRSDFRLDHARFCSKVRAQARAKVCVMRSKRLLRPRRIKLYKIKALIAAPGVTKEGIYVDGPPQRLN